MQYADDSNFFLQDQNSVKNVIKYFQKLQNATGATINFEKTTVILINTDNSSNLSKQIKIKEQFETMKILGILFNKDLHYANQINWENIIEKMEKHISKLSTRTLSLYRKTIIINTLILSKTSFLSNDFPIDHKNHSKIHQKIFQYIWKNKQEAISRKTLFQNKKLGGLNLLEPQAHNIAMRIKHILQIKQTQKTPPWKNLARYWLAIDIHNFSKDFRFSMDNNRTKTINGKSPFIMKT